MGGVKEQPPLVVAIVVLRQLQRRVAIQSAARLLLAVFDNEVRRLPLTVNRFERGNKQTQYNSEATCSYSSTRNDVVGGLHVRGVRETAHPPLPQ